VFNWGHLWENEGEKARGEGKEKGEGRVTAKNICAPMDASKLDL